MTKIEKIKKEVLEKEFQLIENNFNLTEEELKRALYVIHSRVIELTIKKTAKEIFKEIEDYVLYVLYIGDMSVIDDLKKKWGVEDVS